MSEHKFFIGDEAFHAIGNTDAINRGVAVHIFGQLEKVIRREVYRTLKRDITQPGVRSMAAARARAEKPRRVR